MDPFSRLHDSSSVRMPIAKRNPQRHSCIPNILDIRLSGTTEIVQTLSCPMYKALMHLTLT